MQARAYVLIEAAAGQVLEVLAALRRLPGIRAADVIPVRMTSLPSSRPRTSAALGGW
jgi:hypothetical protein